MLAMSTIYSVTIIHELKPPPRRLARGRARATQPSPSGSSGRSPQPTCRRSAGSRCCAAVKRSPSGPPRMSDLAEWLTLSRGGITKLVDRLEAAGYLERVTCAEDRASLQAELTPAGESMLAEMRDRLRGRARAPPQDAQRRGGGADRRAQEGDREHLRRKPSGHRRFADRRPACQKHGRVRRNASATRAVPCNGLNALDLVALRFGDGCEAGATAQGRVEAAGRGRASDRVLELETAGGRTPGWVGEWRVGRGSARVAWARRMDRWTMLV